MPHSTANSHPRPLGEWNRLRSTPNRWGDRYSILHAQATPLSLKSMRSIMKSIMTAQTEKWRKLRQQARALGLCITCRKTPSKGGGSVCEQCNERAKMHVVRMRLRRKEERRTMPGAQACEAAGDAARQQAAYDAASKHFEKAISLSSNRSEKARIAFKLACVIWESDRPHLATPWLTLAAKNYLATGSLSNAIDVIGGLGYQRWIDGRYNEGLQDCDWRAELLHELEEKQSPSLGNASRIREDIALDGSQFLVQTGRDDQAWAQLDLAKALAGTRRAATYYRVRGIYYANSGNVTQAFTNFRQSVEEGVSVPRDASLISSWHDYATYASELGHIRTAQTNFEQALMIARRRRIAWRIPYTMLRLAAHVLATGDYKRAEAYLKSANAHCMETPLLELLRAYVAVELARVAGDTTT